MLCCDFNKNWPSPNSGSKTLVCGNVNMLQKIEVCHPQWDSVLHVPPFWISEISGKQIRSPQGARCCDSSLANHITNSRLPTKFSNLCHILHNLKGQTGSKTNFHSFLQFTHVNAKPSYDSACCYRSQPYSSQINRVMLPQALHGVVVANLQLYLRNGASQHQSYYRMQRCDLPNGVLSSDLDWPLKHISSNP